MIKFRFILVFFLLIQHLDGLYAQDKRSLVLIVDDANVSDIQVFDRLNKVFDGAEFKLDELHILDIDFKKSKYSDVSNKLEVWKDEDNEDYKMLRKHVKEIISFQTVVPNKSKNDTVSLNCDKKLRDKEICSRLMKDPIIISGNVKYFAVNSEDEADIELENKSGELTTFEGSHNLSSLEFNEESATYELRKFLQTQFKVKQTIVLLYEGTARRMETLRITPELNPTKISVGDNVALTLKVKTLSGTDVTNKEINNESITISPSQGWSISESKATYEVSSEDTTRTYTVRISDKLGCQGVAQFKLRVDPSSKKPQAPKNSSEDGPADSSTDGLEPTVSCDCGDGSQLDCAFDELEWPDYKRITRKEYATDGYLVFATKGTSNVYNLITTRNCAKKWTLRVFGDDESEFFKKVYSYDDVTSSGILKKPGMSDYFVFRIDLNRKSVELEDYLYFRVEIESADSDGSCDPLSSPNIIFSPCHK